MIVHLPDPTPEVHLPNQGPPLFLTLASLARKARVHRASVFRQVAQGLLIPDAFVELGTAAQPAFLEKRVVDVLRNAQTPKRSPNLR